MAVPEMSTGYCRCILNDQKEYSEGNLGLYAITPVYGVTVAQSIKKVSPSSSIF